MKSIRIADILYGLIFLTPELEKQIEEGKIMLGGCVVCESSPKWVCMDCKTKIYKVT